MERLAVIAIGGNSLIRDEKHRTVPDQYEAVVETCRHIARLVEARWNVVITHGNGPQVGFILRRSDIARHELHEVPLDSCVADTQGALGYHIQQALGNEFKVRGVQKQVATIVTRTVVDSGDPAFYKPSKPIGAFYSEEEARQREESDGWDIAEDSGRGWRRMVASPPPQEIVELPVIRAMVEAGIIVVAVGGGGIAVAKDERGLLMGVSAVIDKDLASSLLARQLGAELLVISTAVDRVALNFGTSEQIDLETVTLEEAKRYMAEGHFKPGSMQPKIKAIISFLAGGGKRAIVARPESIPEAVAGKTGTTFIP